MTKTITLGMLLLIATASRAQDANYNRFSLDAQFGFNNPISPMATGYDSPTFGLFHTGLGGRYMFNPKFGLRLGVNYDHLGNRSGTPDFNTDYYAASIEGVVNLGKVLDFEAMTNRFGILLHAGLGYSAMDGASSSTSWNHMMHAVGGITPQFKLNERWSLYADVMAKANIYQQRTFDFTQRNTNRGIDGYLYNFSVGVQYNFGPHPRHADWTSAGLTRTQTLELQERVRQLEEQQKDDDGDGVANYLDQEPGTAAGATVDTKGRTVVEKLKDSDSDGLTDDIDDCPFEKGTPRTKGCPEASINGGSGTPSASAIGMVESSEVKFATDVAEVDASFARMLDGVATVMKENPTCTLNIIGHADDRASEEYNMALSQRRADAVKSYLTGKGIAASRLTTTAKGESDPKSPGKSVEARAENRRVQFDIK